MVTINAAGRAARRTLAGVTVLLCATVPASFAAQPQTAIIPASRQAAFDIWQREHRDQESRLTDIKTRTKELLETYVPYVPPLTYRAETTADLMEMRLEAQPVIWRVPGKFEVWDDVTAPRLIVIPAGEFTMGPSPQADHEDSKGPRRRVRIAYPFAVSQYPITVTEFAIFAAETGHEVINYCHTFVEDKWDYTIGCTWRSPGFQQQDDSPVVTLDWHDAQAYVAWLSKRTGKRYRLLSESEYEYATRAGTTTSYWWGDDVADACKYANGADLDAKAHKDFSEWQVNDCRDGYVHPAPVSALKANRFGLFGMTGNTWVWVADCWSDTPAIAPTDGSPQLTGVCTRRIVRGGSWADRPNRLRSDQRGWNFANIRFAINGLRIAREL